LATAAGAGGAVAQRIVGLTHESVPMGQAAGQFDGVAEVAADHDPSEEALVVRASVATCGATGGLENERARLDGIGGCSRCP